MSDMEWGPYIEHDGGGVPPTPVGNATIKVFFDSGTGLIVPGDGFDAPGWPGFFWRWKRVRIGWFKTELRRVCDDPAYAPIRGYRLRKPRLTAATRLAEIVATPPGAWIRDATDSDGRLPKRVKA